MTAARPFAEDLPQPENLPPVTSEIDMTEEPFDRLGQVADGQDERGAQLLAMDEEEGTAADFRQRELHCRNRAEQCSRHDMRGTYLGFAARYAAQAACLEAEGVDGPMKLTIV